MAGHASAQKLRLTDSLPRSPGVYLFRNARGDVLYVGKATNLRARVRSYFSGDDRRKIGSLLRETAHIDHIVHPHPLSAAVHEIRLIHKYMPGYNRQLKDWGRYVYVKLTLSESFPRLSIVKDVRDDGDLYLGPLSSRSSAQRVVDAIHTSVPLRRCAGRIGKRALRDAPCTAAQLGVSMCPCAGGVDPDDYRLVVERAVQGLTTEPDLLLGPLAERIAALASDERFEEAADVRDRASALAGALKRQRKFDQLRRAGHIHIDLGPLGGVALDHGRLQSAWGEGELPSLGLPSAANDALYEQGSLAPPDREMADELGCIAAWLDKNAPDLTLDHCDGVLSSTLPALPSFAPRKGIAVDDSEFVSSSRRSRR